ncbi:MAG: cation transporter [Betaproteobacteria bacterium]|nr:MAG: cation transporter [Betaproteobacteria bacterium]RPI45693.1 MAG: cation transporter [Betaproteobacteria bacterium]
MPTTVETEPERIVARVRTRPSPAHLTSLAVTLFLFWLMLSGYVTPFLIAAGIGCALLISALAARMRLVDSEGHPLRLGVRAIFGYWPWLLKEIVKSALQVSWVVLHPRLPISPTLVRFKPSQTSDLALVIHANSITLTPGTICIEAGPDEFLVHALTEAGAAGVGTHSAMDRRVTRLEQAR